MKDEIKEAAEAVKAAQRTRKKYASKGNLLAEPRIKDIDEALARLKAAMKPLRSAIGRFPFEPQTETAENRQRLVRLASEAIQKERIKLWKMQNASKKAQDRG